MPDISLNDLTDLQRRAWQMRYQYGWRLRKIAGELGVSAPAVSRLLRRARCRAGLPGRRVSVISARPRLAHVRSLSDVVGA